MFSAMLGGCGPGDCGASSPKKRGEWAVSLEDEDENGFDDDDDDEFKDTVGEVKPSANTYPRLPEDQLTTVTFEEGPLGFRLMTAPDGTHIVMELTEGAQKGQATDVGLKPADIIMGLNDELLWEVHMDHETLLTKLKTTPRPFTMKIGRTISQGSQCVQQAGEQTAEEKDTISKEGSGKSVGADSISCGAKGPYLFGGLLLMKQFGAQKAGYLWVLKEKDWLWRYCVLREDGEFFGLFFFGFKTGIYCALSLLRLLECALCQCNCANVCASRIAVLPLI
jgi:hypothetical protein